jgi:hypothetical protein
MAEELNILIYFFIATESVSLHCNGPPTSTLLTLGVTENCLVIGSYWKLSSDWELLEVVWSLGVTGSCLVMESYWKLSGHWELLEVVWSFGVTESCLDIGSYWELSCDWELLEVVL